VITIWAWTNRKKRNISYFFPIGWNRRVLFPWVCKLRLWDWGQVGNYNPFESDTAGGININQTLKEVFPAFTFKEWKFSPLIAPGGQKFSDKHMRSENFGQQRESSAKHRLASIILVFQSLFKNLDWSLPEQLAREAISKVPRKRVRSCKIDHHT
jgi:hypothetical protein